MNFSFRFVHEKVSCILCGWPVTHRSPNVDPTRPATGAGRPDRSPSLVDFTQLPLHASSAQSYVEIPVAIVESEILVAGFCQVSPFGVINLMRLKSTNIFRTKPR